MPNTITAPDMMVAQRVSVGALEAAGMARKEIADALGYVGDSAIQHLMSNEPAPLGGLFALRLGALAWRRARCRAIAALMDDPGEAPYVLDASLVAEVAGMTMGAGTALASYDPASLPALYATDRSLVVAADQITAARAQVSHDIHACHAAHAAMQGFA